ncbi:protein-glutamate O-methyltransferase CheR [Sulfurimonas sp. MAG313]|nr:protein-glutamate O-methyltransferase CheR [Sulfurimonas sp. MAG313]MDF1881120.1 protein-glutamate O-methyltransferase CheR [Sulfurimonas sp. MAG313]
MFNEGNFSKLSEFIYRKSGIFLEESKHYEKIHKFVLARLDELELDNFRKYFFTLRFEDPDGIEFQTLMNAVTVNETYFFREHDQFEVLVNDVLPLLHKTRPKDEPLRILSSPCSTGEEPYSMVLYLLEEANLIEERDIEIIGIDIDSTVIKKAQDGKFSERSVHAIPPVQVQNYFKKKGLSYHLIDDLVGTVEFKVVNIFDRAALRELGKFDVIFSRNMLIYFDDASKKEVAMNFYDMLKPGGFVFLGHAEYMSRIVSVFKAKKFGGSLIYQK